MRHDGSLVALYRHINPESSEYRSTGTRDSGDGRMISPRVGGRGRGWEGAMRIQTWHGLQLFDKILRARGKREPPIYKPEAAG